MHDDTMPNHAEYTVTQKAEGRYLRRRILLISLYVLFALSYAVTAILIQIVQVIALLPLFLWIIAHFTWRYVSLEHTFTISEGTLTVTDVLKDGKKIPRLQIVLRDARDLSPLPSAAHGGKAVFDYRGDKCADNAFSLSFRHKNGDALLYFRATPEFLKTLKRFVK